MTGTDPGTQRSAAPANPDDPARHGDRSGSSRRRRLLVIGSLYLVSDIGYSFFLAALGTILLSRGVSLNTVALINLLGMIYFARFLIGPLVDRFGSPRLGHYRGWLVLTQIAMILILAGVALLDPIANLAAVLALLTAVLALSAFHDTAINGLAVRMLPAADHGIANGIQVAAASLSIIIGSGGALLLYARAGWTTTLFALAAVFGIPLLVLARLAEPPAGRPERGAAQWLALFSFFRRRRTATWTVLVIPLFVLGDWLANVPQSPMLLAAGWSLDRIAFVQYTLATGTQILAALAAGAAITRYGRTRPALVAGVLAVAATAALLPLATGHDSPGLTTAALIAGAVAYGAKLTWVSTVSMDLARKSSAATDVTLPMSMVGILRIVVSSAGLGLVARVGYPWLIGAAVFFAVAGTAVALAWTRTQLERQPVSSGGWT
ncbi:MFS transporter [Amycolatopsis anabasis]|uniref:MFS transporter n=1 Tax=Amycolatopsis anabasis TaxID=1840409 RepID=UPI00131E3056|nr:MFS transporter [Amycolatopsis anabasis]